MGGECLLNTATANAQQKPVITSLASGGFVVSWTDNSLQGDTSSSGIKAQITAAVTLPSTARLQIDALERAP